MKGGEEASKNANTVWNSWRRSCRESSVLLTALTYQSPAGST